MESSSWSINPSDILRYMEHTNEHGDYSINDNYTPEKNAPAKGFSDPTNKFENLLDLDYADVDNFLTQELNDLDIPMIPEGNGYQNNGNIDNFDWGQLKLDDPYNMSNLVTTPGNNKHKRGASGTAIFGFADHNKTLSITNTKNNQPLENNSHYKYSNQNNMIESVEEISNSNSGSNAALGTALLKQQEELRIALEKQKEMNKKLEHQLMENRKHQEQLQDAIKQQEVATHQLVSEVPIQSPNTVRTPNSKRTKNDNEIIITSNSKNGSYQFPPTSMVSPPMSNTNTSRNGSPSRKVRQRSYMSRFQISDGIDKFDFGNDKQYQMENTNAPARPFKFSSPMSNIGNRSGPFTPTIKNGFSSNRLSQSHRKKDSTMSTASTIPQVIEDDISDDEYPSTLGLGLQFMPNKHQNDIHSYQSGNPQVDVMPTIQGSSNNTPVKGTLPKKHTFQHTPIKVKSKPLLQHSDYDSNFDENMFSELLSTPQLKPPSMVVTMEDGNNGRRNSTNGNSNYLKPGHIENKFRIVESPSPGLRKFDSFDDRSPQYNIDDSITGSPIKITRKLTTLPRGSIDIYVKELPNKLFECLYPDCHKLFKRRYNVRSHIQTHLEDKPYVCDFEDCDKSFVRNHDLARHKKLHLTKGLKCPCGKTFGREDTMISHRSRMICSGGKKYEKLVTKKSPKKSPVKSSTNKHDGTASINSSPVKDSVTKNTDGFVIYKLEQQLRNEMENSGLLQPPSNMLMSGTNILLSPSPSSGFSDLGSPLTEILDPLTEVLNN